MRSAPLKRRGLITDINMIPLIDVMLLLLIIFMVMTPLLVQSQIQVRLPKTTRRAQAMENPITLQITRRGKIYLNGKSIKRSRLEKKLALALKKSSQKAVLVQADKSVRIDKIVPILDIARRLGVGKLGIGVRER